MQKAPSASTAKHSTGSKTQALMVRIDHAGTIVTITANKEFVLSAKTVDTRTREIVADAKVTVLKDTTLHFVASSSLPGWYYICRVDAHGHIGCTCPGCTNRHYCEHQKSAWDAHQARQNRQDAAKIVPMLSQLEDKQVAETAHCMPSVCPIVAPIEMTGFEFEVVGRDDEEFSEKVVDRWRDEAMDRAMFIAVFNPCSLA